MTYDPGFSNTASWRSSICYIDGEEGVLEYRGIPIEQLCEHSNYLKVAYLLIYGYLPTEDEYNDWTYRGPTRSLTTPSSMGISRSSSAASGIMRIRCVCSLPPWVRSRPSTPR